jgi:hypothetical protein
MVFMFTRPCRALVIARRSGVARSRIPVGGTLPAIKPGSQVGGAGAFRLIPLITVKRKPQQIGQMGRGASAARFADG